MGKVLFTSDLHFGHENVIRFDGRPFSTVEEMDNELIRRSGIRPWRLYLEKPER